MTPDSINERLATKIMGWHHGKSPHGHDFWMNVKNLLERAAVEWNPYGDIAQAFMVLNKWCETNDGEYMISGDHESAAVIIMLENGPDNSWRSTEDRLKPSAAICSALVAWMERNQKEKSVCVNW